MKNEKRILVIKMSSADALTSSNMRTIALIKGLVSLRYKIYWLTIPDNSEVAKRKINEYDFMTETIIVETEENKAYTYVTKQNNGIKRYIVNKMRGIYHILNLYDYTLSIARHFDINRLPEREFDFLITVSDPKTSHILGKRLIKEGIKINKWIQYWGDPLRGDITRKKIYPDWYLGHVEEKLMKEADKIIYTSPFTLKEEKNFHPRQAHKMQMLPTAYIEERIFERKNKSKKVFGYFGAYYSNVRNITPLYNVISKRKEDSELIIVGDSDLILEERDNIRVFNRGDVSKLEQEIDAYICMLNSSGTQIPGKIYHNAGTNLPIIVLMDGDDIEEMERFLKGFDRYIVYKNTEEEIDIALDEVVNRDKKWMPCKKMNPKTVAEKFLYGE